MKCVNIRIPCKVKEILAFNALEFFSPWTCFGNIWKIKNLFLLLILENMFLLPLWNLKEHNLLKNRQAFSQSIGEIFLTYFFSNMHVKRNLRTRLLVTKRTEAMPWSNQKLVRESQNSARKVLSISLKLQTTRLICDGHFV